MQKKYVCCKYFCNGSFKLSVYLFDICAFYDLFAVMWKGCYFCLIIISIWYYVCVLHEVWLFISFLNCIILAGYCAYLDVENALDPSLAEAMGIDAENLLIAQPDSAENLLSVVDTLTKSGSIDVIVVDSVSDSFFS